MQQQPTTTSNLQIKLITDARKLLEKVRSQQAISADSSFDSSFLFHAMQDKDKDRDKEVNSMNLKEEMIINAIRARAAAAASISSQHGHGHERQGRADATTTERESKTKSSPSSIISNHKPYNENAIGNGPGPGLPPRSGTKGPTAKSNKSKNNKSNTSNGKYGDSVVHVLQENESNVENLQRENMKLKIENYELHEEMSDFEYKLYCLEHTLGIIEDVERSSQSSNASNASVGVTGNGSGGNGRNGRNDRNGDDTNNEMKVNDNDRNRGMSSKGNDNNMHVKRPNPLSIKTCNDMNSNNNNNNGSSLESNNDTMKLSPITAMVADAMIDGSGLVTNVSSLVQSKSSPGRQAPPNTPIVQSQNQFQYQYQNQYQNQDQNQILTHNQQNEIELQILRENNAKMVVAIKALAQATIAQTRKHYLYKKRHHMTKLMVVEESEKAHQYYNEKEQIQKEFYQTRSDFLKEKDIREELSSELQLVAKRNNLLRRERELDEMMKQKIIERLEYRDNDAMSVLSRLSQSSCFPVLQTITEAGSSTSENSFSHNSNNSNASMGSSGSGCNNRNGHGHGHGHGHGRSERDKGVEKLVFKLISQLKKRDEKIAKLEKKLKITMQYLEGALELEVARQDAEVAANGNGNSINGHGNKNGNANGNAMVIPEEQRIEI